MFLCHDIQSFKAFLKWEKRKRKKKRKKECYNWSSSFSCFSGSYGYGWMLSTEVKRDNESLMIQNQSLVCFVKPDISLSFHLARRAYTVSYFFHDKNIHRSVLLHSFLFSKMKSAKVTCESKLLNGMNQMEVVVQEKKNKTTMMNIKWCWYPGIFICGSLVVTLVIFL